MNLDFFIDTFFENLKNNEYKYYKNELNKLSSVLKLHLNKQSNPTSLEMFGSNIADSEISIPEILSIIELLKDEVFSSFHDMDVKTIRDLKIKIDNAKNLIAKGYLYKSAINLRTKIDASIKHQKSSLFIPTLKMATYFRDVLDAIVKGQDYSQDITCDMQKLFELMENNDITKDIEKNEKSICYALKKLINKITKGDFSNALYFFQQIILNYFYMISNIYLLQRTKSFSSDFVDSTGSLNKKAFDVIYFDILEVSKNSNIPSCLMMIEVANLSEVYDKYGAKIANEFLSYIVSNIKKNLRQYDNIFKYKEGVFDILLINETPETANIIINRIKKSFVDSYFKYEGITIVPRLNYKTKVVL